MKAGLAGRAGLLLLVGGCDEATPGHEGEVDAAPSCEIEGRWRLTVPAQDSTDETRPLEVHEIFVELGPAGATLRHANTEGYWTDAERTCPDERWDCAGLRSGTVFRPPCGLEFLLLVTDTSDHDCIPEALWYAWQVTGDVGEGVTALWTLNGWGLLAYEHCREAPPPAEVCEDGTNRCSVMPLRVERVP